MYNNTGSKLKHWAKILLVAETLGTIILGISAWTAVSALWGAIFLLGGLIASWFLFGILYGFGEQIEATINNEKNTAIILKLLQQQNLFITKEQPNTVTSSPKNEKIIAIHKWRCVHCGNMREKNPCEHCQKE